MNPTNSTSPAPTQNAEDDDVVLIPQKIDLVDLTGDEISVTQIVRPRIDPIVTMGPNLPAGTRQTRSTVSTQNAFRIPMASSIFSGVQGTSRTFSVQGTPFTFSGVQGTSRDLPARNEETRINCRICKANVVGSLPVVTKCGHVFCDRCLMRAMKQVRECPACKRPMRPRADHFNLRL